MTEKILCAAIWYKDFDKPVHSPINTECGVVMCGYRHAHIIGQCVELLGKNQFQMGEYVQGFLTTKNRFVDRMEGAKIHIENGGKLNYHTYRLFPEDLY